MLYLNVRKSRTTQISFSTLIGDALQPQDGLLNQLLRWLMWYWCIVESLTISTFFLLMSSIRRSTNKRFDMCSILERQHCRSGYKSTIVCSDDINTHECYLIRTTPHIVTLSHLIDVETQLNILIVFGGVSKVMRHLSIAMCYVWTSTSHERRNHLFVCSSEMLFNPKMVSLINFYDDLCDIDVPSSRWRY